MRPPPTSTLFPYTTLFRSEGDRSAPARRAGVRHARAVADRADQPLDRKSTRLNSSHANISYAVFCLKKKKQLPYPVDQLGARTYMRPNPFQPPRLYLQWPP